MADLVVVEHDHVDAALLRPLQRGEAGRAAIDADDQAGAAVDEVVDRLDVRPVALEDAVWDVDARRAAERGEHAVQERRRRRAVDVVVAEDRHQLPRLDRIGEARRGDVHVGERGRVGEIALQRRRQEGGRRIQPHPAPGKHAGKALGGNAALRHGRRHSLAARVEPRQPGAPGARSRDAEEVPLRRPLFCESPHDSDYGPGSPAAEPSRGAFRILLCSSTS